MLKLIDSNQLYLAFLIQSGPDFWMYLKTIFLSNRNKIRLYLLIISMIWDL